MNLTKMIITPSMAKSILENNFKNRKVHQNRVDQYANDMLNGKWKSNTGEVLKITKSKRFVDGQHRLHAVIKANIPVEFYIITNVDDDVFDVLDSGRPRNTSDIFYISEVKNGNGISSMINQYLVLKKGFISAQSASRQKNTSQDILSFYNENPEYYQLVYSYVSSWYHSFGKVITCSTIGGYYLFLKDIDEDDAKKFMNELCTGADISNNCILLLRHKLINDRTSKLTKMPVKLKHAFIIKTWNYFRTNQKVNILRFIEQTESLPIAR
jgi:hypothetical protein